MWILFAFGSALFAGLTAILAKCGIRNTDSNVATALRTGVVLVFFMAYGICGRGTKRNQRYFSKSPDLSDFVRTVNGNILAMLLQSTSDRSGQCGSSD